MKIVALLTQRSYSKSFLVEVSESELNHLVGEIYGNTEFSIGDEIKASELFKRLDSMNRNRGAVTSCTKQLRALADMMESFDPVVRKVIEGDCEVIEDELRSGVPTNEQ